MLKKYKTVEVKKSLFIFITNQRGSLVGALMAFGLLGVAATGLFTYIQHFHKTSTQTAEQINFNPQFLTKVIGNMRSVLVDAKKDANGVSEKGICALVKTGTGLKIKKSVEIITLDMIRLSNIGVLDWDKFFPISSGWRFIGDAHPDPDPDPNKCNEVVGQNTTFANSNLMKCFEYKGAREQGIKSMWWRKFFQKSFLPVTVQVVIWNLEKLFFI